MDGDREMTADQALEVQAEAQQAGCLMIWTVYYNTSDYRERWVARPSAIGPLGRSLSLAVVLLADTLEALRVMLPPGLSRLNRRPEDETVVVEVWL